MQPHFFKIHLSHFSPWVRSVWTIVWTIPPNGEFIVWTISSKWLLTSLHGDYISLESSSSLLDLPFSSSSTSKSTLMYELCFVILFLPLCSSVYMHAQSCLTLCDPMDCSPAGSPVHEMFQARILEWVVVSFSRGSSWPRVESVSRALAGRFFTTLPPGKPDALLPIC